MLDAAKLGECLHDFLTGRIETVVADVAYSEESPFIREVTQLTLYHRGI